MSIGTNIPPRGLAPRAFSISDAAQRMGISRATLFREINRGRLTALKVGSKTIVTDAAIEAWLAALPVRNPTTA